MARGCSRTGSRSRIGPGRQGAARTTLAGFAPGGSGAKLPVSDRITRVSVQATRTGYRRTVDPECHPHSWRMMCATSAMAHTIDS
jgi:hypothetical protein